MLHNQVFLVHHICFFRALIRLCTACSVFSISSTFDSLSVEYYFSTGFLHSLALPCICSQILQLKFTRTTTTQPAAFASLPLCPNVPGGLFPGHNQFLSCFILLRCLLIHPYLHPYHHHHHHCRCRPSPSEMRISDPRHSASRVDLITRRMSFRVVLDSVSSKIAIPRYLGEPGVIKTRDITCKLL